MTTKDLNTTLIGMIEGSEFGISDIDRIRNLHITGVYTESILHLICRMLIQDVYNKKPFLFFDMHNKSIDAVLPYIPNYNIDQIIYLDPENIYQNLNVDYTNLSETSNNEYIEILVNSLNYKNIIDERIGMIFRADFECFTSEVQRKKFIYNVIIAFQKILFSRLQLPTYRKPLFTFYLTDLSADTYDLKKWSNMFEDQLDQNFCLVTTSQKITNLPKPYQEELLMMYGNLIILKPEERDLEIFTKLFKSSTVEQLRNLKDTEAIFKIFYNGEKQKEFKAQLYQGLFERFGYEKIIASKQLF
ncbi:hypothetical protein D6810_00300 [Candidatus Dojkabacteria bacterium]|uniref:Uncharacterized protein n=1 Tax=Candidatus Dojkabacteria bacterium TaxID=2099670 RepID=A0A3M0Z029_9BACT|nr:MAG: hypothetical protein D6810_00300 [Candidatus Dojkabacteria bacterium]